MTRKGARVTRKGAGMAEEDAGRTGGGAGVVGWWGEGWVLFTARYPRQARV